MKTKSFIAILLVAFLASLSGCAKLDNAIARDGGLWGSYKGDWIVVKYSGGKITDVWKLKDVMVQSEEHSDGWVFQDNAGNVFNLGGDTKAIRVKEAKLWDQYREYHMEFSTDPYNGPLK